MGERLFKASVLLTIVNLKKEIDENGEDKLKVLVN